MADMLNRLVAMLGCLIFAWAGGLAGCGSTCPQGQIHCGQSCVDLSQDVEHCGACATVCAAGASCTAGACNCPSGAEVCGNVCVALQTDPDNCGACGHACGLGTCAGGACACDSAPATVRDCGGSPACVDTGGDAKNCGGCGVACPLAGEECSGSACACPTTLPAHCPADAPTACVNTEDDPDNCGGCGVHCLSGSVCSAGACVCGAGLTACPASAPTACVDEQTSGTNCGACGTVCAAGQTCQSGVCCAGSVCDGMCVDTNSNASNCGGCGHVCGSGAACLTGTCCSSGTTAVCTGACCGGGTSCCSGGTCQLQHYNGLGGPQGATFFDCYAAQSLDAAADAALSWAPAGKQPATASQFLSLDCAAWETSDGTQCAVYCATGSAAAGYVKLTLDNEGCVLPTVGDPSSIAWQ